jgi:hypothetical protein
MTGWDDEAGRKTVNPDDHAASIGRMVSTCNRRTEPPAPAEAPRNQERGPHGARSQFYPTQQANAGRTAAFLGAAGRRGRFLGLL